MKNLNTVSLNWVNQRKDLFDAFGVHFAKHIKDMYLSGSTAPQRLTKATQLEALALLLSHAMQSGNTCLELNTPYQIQISTEKINVLVPSLEEIQLIAQNKDQKALALEGSAIKAPLIISTKANGFLTMHKYWTYESMLESAIKLRVNTPNIHDLKVPRCVTNFYPKNSLQSNAILNVSNSRISIIAGGPGTGKTTLAASVLLTILNGKPQCRVAVAAPTGKAASRLEEAMPSAFKLMNAYATEALSIRKIEELKATTIHRLLGPIPGKRLFRHNKYNPLPYDFILVDEASMIDLPLLSKLLDAVSSNASLVLMGDPNQLPSVEVGSIFGDLVSASYLSKQITHLKENFRARNAPGIASICLSIQEGRLMTAEQFVQSTEQWDHISWQNVENEEELDQLIHSAAEIYEDLLNASQTPEEALYKAQNYAVLTSLNDSPFGAKSMNAAISSRLEKCHELIIINRNDPELAVFNGDMGIIPYGENSRRAWFPSKGFISTSRLPSYQPAYALTGHRAQGSEFSQVDVLLPEHSLSPMLTIEWLYTAISRAKSKVKIWGALPALHTALNTHTRRVSSLFR